MRTKSDEIGMLREWCRQAYEEPDSYLAGLMSNGLISYVTTHIERDELPDVHAELMETRQRMLAADEGRNKALQQVNDLKNSRDQELRDLDAANDEVTEQLREQVQNVTIERNKLTRDLASMSLNWQEERDKWACERSTLQLQIMDRDIEINRLKALLWDVHEARESDADAA